MKRLAELEESDIALLPPSMQWLAKTIGLPAVLKLVRQYGGGMPLYVPADFDPNHRLALLIGAEAFAALVMEYGSDKIEIAKCEVATRTLIHRAIRREYYPEVGERAEGVTENYLALKYHYTVRQIRYILYGDEVQQDDRQVGLF